MIRRLGLVAAATLVASMAELLIGAPAEAGAKRRPATTVETGPGHPTSGYYRRGPRVKGYVARRGGYSFSTFDTINTYGDSRTRFGSTSSYRDQTLDRQTQGGPFDHGFFFDSGIAPRGGNSPYMN